MSEITESALIIETSSALNQTTTGTQHESKLCSDCQGYTPMPYNYNSLLINTKFGMNDIKTTASELRLQQILRQKFTALCLIIR